MFDTSTKTIDVLQLVIDIAPTNIISRGESDSLAGGAGSCAEWGTISSWYAGGVYHVDQCKTVDGKQLLDSQVETLVQAMAAFAPPAAGQTSLPTTYQDSLAPVIVAN